MNSFRRLAPALVVALVIALLFGGMVNAPVLAQAAKQQFEWILAKRLTVDTTAAIGGNTTVGGSASVTGNMTVGGALAVTGASTLSGNVAAGASLTTTNRVNVGTLLRLAPATAAVLTADGTLTPVGSYQPISSTAAIGTASIATATTAAGTLMYVINVGSQTITFTDTGVLKLSGNAALGAGDTLLLVSDGAAWNQVSKTDN